MYFDCFILFIKIRNIHHCTTEKLNHNSFSLKKKNVYLYSFHRHVNYYKQASRAVFLGQYRATTRNFIHFFRLPLTTRKKCVCLVNKAYLRAQCMLILAVVMFSSITEANIIFYCLFTYKLHGQFVQLLHIEYTTIFACFAWSYIYIYLKNDSVMQVHKTN